MYDVPHLRFPEFSGEWEKYRLCDVASIVGRIGFRGYTTNDIVTKGKGAIALSPTNIENNKLTYDKDNTYISFYKYEESPEIMIKQGDVIFVKTGSTVGKVAYVDKLICKTTLNPQVVVLKDIQCDNYLLSVLMSTNKFQNAIRKIIVGGAVPTLSQAAMGDIVVTMPQATEQEKLSKFISLLDDRIATQNKIIEKLQSLIKGLAAQLTQSGTPNVRLCDCLECHSSTLQENCVSATGSYPVYGATGLIGYTNGYAYNGESILIVKDGSGVGSLSYANDCYSVIGTLNYLTAKGKYSVLYLYYALMAFNFTPYITGMANSSYLFQRLWESKSILPSIENQIRIASLLHNIEQKLVVEQNLIISLSAQKSYLLRMLFI